MELRLRSMEERGAADTHRVDLPPTSTLADVRALLAAKLSAAEPVPAEAVRLSLNGSEELVSPDPAATLRDLGIASGDLVYFTLSPFRVPEPPAQGLPQNPSPTSTTIVETVDHGKRSEEPGAGGSCLSQVQVLAVDPSVPVAPDSPDVVMWEAVHEAKGWSSPVLAHLKREMGKAGGANATVPRRLVTALHATMLDAGFISLTEMGSGLSQPLNWPESLDVKYTVSELSPILSVSEEGKVAVLEFSLMGGLVMVNGYVSGEESEELEPEDYFELELELSELKPLLCLDSDRVSIAQEREILELWRKLKDEMCLPLLTSLCQLNNLRLPPSLMALPADLKTKVLEYCGGVDLARVECTCKEMRNLAADDNLWKDSCCWNLELFRILVPA